MEKKIIIAIDGHSSCGKSTFAKAVARELNYIYIDSGAMYRAVTLYCMKRNLISNEGLNTAGVIAELNEIHIDFVYNHDISEYETFLNSENVETEIRSMAVTGYVSRISMIQEVRTRMVELQRQIGISKGIVMDGRDIGTIVFPHAEVKIFMTANLDVRAQRRFDELRQKGIPARMEEITANIRERDHQDMNRSISPLIQASDAVVLDNSAMSITDQMEWFRLLLIQKKLIREGG